MSGTCSGRLLHPFHHGLKEPLQRCLLARAERRRHPLFDRPHGLRGHLDEPAPVRGQGKPLVMIPGAGGDRISSEVSAREISGIVIPVVGGYRVTAMCEPGSVRGWDMYPKKYATLISLLKDVKRRGHLVRL